ncbi:hypothetical protein KO465_06065 [Candidatus Micrarchaeota archaeon]|jgi:small subunit ribosomal protein S3Ae|nr:hypothetical protein [Candidatus Micrarchaeota archaeon]
MAKKKEKRKKAVRKITVKKTGKAKTDKWKLKKDYTVVAPKLFEEKEITGVVATDEKQLLNRVIEYPYGNLSGKYDELSMYTTVKLRIVEIKGKTAHTRITGTALASGFLKTLARRRRSVINEFRDVKTKDNEIAKLKTTVFTQRKISTSAKTAIRRIISDYLVAKSAEMTLNELIDYILSNKLEKDTKKDLHKVAPIKKVFIHKIDVKNTVV